MAESTRGTPNWATMVTCFGLYSTKCLALLQSYDAMAHTCMIQSESGFAQTQ